ncbi:MAG: hypothetical protein ABSG25_13970 [Bryobacteraceae bacterium]
MDVGEVDGAFAEVLIQFVHHAAEALLAVIVIEERHVVQLVGDQAEEPDADLQRSRLWAAFPQARQVGLQGESIPALADA